MKYVEVDKDKVAEQVALAGVHTDMEWTGASLTRLTLEDHAGHVLVIESNWSGLRVRVPAPPEMVDAWAVVGEHEDPNVVIARTFHQEEHEADQRVRDLEGITGTRNVRKEKVKIEKESLTSVLALQEERAVRAAGA